MATEPITSQNTQQFNDDDIVDNFGEGPAVGPDRAHDDGRDDGTPLGLGGEKGKQSEPASSTLEADMLAPPPKQTKQEQTPSSGDDLPSDDASAGGAQEPEQATAGDDGEVEPEPVDEPAAPEYPAVLLQLAGFSSVEAAQKAGFKDPESLLAAVQWRGQSLAQPTKPHRLSYLETQTPEPPPTKLPAETPPKGDDTAFTPFQPANPDEIDEGLLKLIDAQNKHFSAQYERLASQLKSREEEAQQRHALQQAEQFDAAVQKLGKDWEEEFGHGGADTLFGRTDAESIAAAQARLGLFDAVNIVRRTNAGQGGKPMSLEQEIQWALMQTYPEKFKQQLRRVSDASAQPRRGIQASRPTARKAPLVTKNDRILAALSTKFPNVDFSTGDNEVGGEF